MGNSKSLLDEARLNILNICNDLEETMHIVEILQSKGHKYFCEGAWYNVTAEGTAYTEGLSQMRNALYSHYCKMITRAFCLIGVPNEEMQEYAKKKFVERFGGDSYEIMSFLTNNGQSPGAYKATIEEEFRKEIDEEIKKIKQVDTPEKP